MFNNTSHSRFNISMAALAGFVAGCAGEERPLPDPDAQPLADIALIVAIPEYDFGQAILSANPFVLTMIKSVDDRLASDYACASVEKDWNIWTGPEIDWKCTRPADEGTTWQGSSRIATAIGIPPGQHRIVLIRDEDGWLSCNRDIAICNYVRPSKHAFRTELTLNAERGHRYKAMIESSGDRYDAWITDDVSGAVVAGTAPPD